MITLSQHLSRALFPGLILVLMCSGLLIHTLISSSLTSEFDRGLESRSQSLMAITEQDEDGVELEVYPDALTSYFQEYEPDYFEVRNRSGDRLFHSLSLQDDQTLVITETTTDSIIDAPLPDGRAGRFIQRHYFPKIDIDDDTQYHQSTDELSQTSAFAPSGASIKVNGVKIVPEKVHVIVATSREALDDHLTQLTMILVLTGFVTLAVVILLQRGAIRRAVQPIEDISQQINSLNVEKMDRHLTLTHPILELQVLTDRFNGMMQRLHDGFQRERRFSADLAHEMRTPLAELRSLAEVSQRWPADQTLKASFNDDVVISVGRMERLIHSLSALSRGDIGLLEASGAVDLVELIPQVVALHQCDIDGLHYNVIVTLPDRSVIVDGEVHWCQVLENLIENAVNYSPTGSTIDLDLSIEDAGNRFVFVIENDAPTLDESDLARLFDRLWRKDGSRADAQHSGLGLSLVKMYTLAVNARIESELVDGGRLRLSVTGVLGNTDNATVSLESEDEIRATG